MSSDFADLLKRLAEADVDFVIVGGPVGLGFWGLGWVFAAED